jgi:hypothetical protein
MRCGSPCSFGTDDAVSSCQVYATSGARDDLAVVLRGYMLIHLPPACDVAVPCSLLICTKTCIVCFDFTLVCLQLQIQIRRCCALLGLLCCGIYPNRLLRVVYQLPVVAVPD